MGDLVERLRKHVNDRGSPAIENGAWQMMLDAAGEIERLREALGGIDQLATRHVKGAIGMAQRIARRALSQDQRQP